MKKYLMLFLLFMGGLQAAVEKKGFWGEWTENVAAHAENINTISMLQRTKGGNFSTYNFNDQELKNFKDNLKQMKFTSMGPTALQVENTQIVNLFRYDEDCLQKAHEAAEKYKLMREWQERNPYYFATMGKYMNSYTITKVSLVLTLGYLLMPRFAGEEFCPGER